MTRDMQRLIYEERIEKLRKKENIKNKLSNSFCFLGLIPAAINGLYIVVIALGLIDIFLVMYFEKKQKERFEEAIKNFWEKFDSGEIK